MGVFILIMGILRIIQASCNKETSAFMESKDIFFRYGMLFEFSSAVFGLVYLGIVGLSGLNVIKATLLRMVLGAQVLSKTAIKS